jgi:hypothetical protein
MTYGLAKKPVVRLVYGEDQLSIVTRERLEFFMLLSIDWQSNKGYHRMAEVQFR